MSLSTPDHPAPPRDSSAPKTVVDRRPAAVLVVGILHLILGTIGVIWAGGSTLEVFAGPEVASRLFTPQEQQDQARLEQRMNREAPFYREYLVVAHVIFPWVLTVMLLAGGVGLILWRLWAWWLAIGYGLLSILHKAIVGFYLTAFLSPYYLATVSATGGTGASAADMAEGTAAMVFVLMPLILMVYPAAVVVVMCRPRVAAGFRRAGGV
jgi:hypothetical protein